MTGAEELEVRQKLAECRRWIRSLQREAKEIERALDDPGRDEFVISATDEMHEAMGTLWYKPHTSEEP
jgi:hypothetical protein